MYDDAKGLQHTNKVHILDGYLSEQEYCEQRGISRRSAQRERRLRQGPPHVLIGIKVYYRIEAVRTWLLGREKDCGTFSDALSRRRGR